jgi:hypothetical protein
MLTIRPPTPHNNKARPPSRRVRVLLSDPPIDWSSIHSAADYRPWIDKGLRYVSAAVAYKVST